MVANKARKDELGHKYPRLRRTVSAANFTSAGRKGYSAIHSEHGGNLVFQIGVFQIVLLRYNLYISLSQFSACFALTLTFR